MTSKSLVNDISEVEKDSNDASGSEIKLVSKFSLWRRRLILKFSI